MVLFGIWMLKRPSRFLHDEKSDPQLAAKRIVRPGRTAGVRLHGSLVLCSATTSTVNLAQRCTSSWILCCASVENALNTKNQQQFGKTYFVSTPECCEVDNLDGKHFVVEWQIFFPRAHYNAASPRSPKYDGGQTSNPLPRTSRTASFSCR